MTNAVRVLPEITALTDRIANRSVSREEWKTLLKEFGQLIGSMQAADVDYLLAHDAGRALLEARYGDQPRVTGVSCWVMLLADRALESASSAHMRGVYRELKTMENFMTPPELQYIADSSAGEMLYHALAGLCPRADEGVIP